MDIESENVIFILFVVIIIVWVYGIYFSNDTLPINSDCFKSNIDDKDIELLEIQLEKKLLHPTRYISVHSFNEIVETIRLIVYRDLYLFSQVCAKMNGPDGPEK